ncbi:MAG: hypothetical protein KC731_04295, partial [Myxococcales bacterium]|nr:hypothetical protein [Myxococcales bacterium]
MDAREAKQVLEDLEPKVERLKALYQQYFMGIEKIPPHVLRKDVERTIWLLRRTRFQNTQLRFKFQQIIQRYNTYGQYWARILREIEKGTYKRDLVRAAKRFGKDGIVEGGRGAEAALRSLHLDEEEGADRERPQVWDITEGMDDGFDVSELDDIPTPPNMSVSPQSYQDPRAWSFSSSPPAPDHAGYPAYPSQSYGDQGYPAQSYPAAQDYQAQGYQAEAYQAEGYQAQGY